MKKRIIAALLAALSLTILLAACGGDEGMATREISRWPSNKYTKEMVKPKHGKPCRAVYDEAMDYYCVYIKDITREESEEYVEKLKDKGFSELQGADNTAELNVVLKKDNVYLSIMEDGDELGISITFGSEN